MTTTTMLQSEKTRSLALVVGSSKYKDENGTTRTTEAVTHNLRAVNDLFRGSWYSVRVFEDCDCAEKFRSSIELAAKTHVDLLFIYYTGHAVPVSRSLHLCFPFTQLNTIAASGIDIAFIVNCIAASPAQYKALVLECCHAGTAARTTCEALWDNPSTDGIYFLGACAGHQVALAEANGKPSLFTGALLQALDSAAKKGQKRISLSDLAHDLVKQFTTVPSLQIMHAGDSNIGNHIEIPCPSSADVDACTMLASLLGKYSLEWNTVTAPPALQLIAFWRLAWLIDVQRGLLRVRNVLADVAAGYNGQATDDATCRLYATAAEVRALLIKWKSEGRLSSWRDDSQLIEAICNAIEPSLVRIASLRGTYQEVLGPLNKYLNEIDESLFPVEQTMLPERIRSILSMLNKSR